MAEELNLEQSKRELESKSIDQQLKYIASDFDLQTQISDRLNKMEEGILDQANKLTTEAKSTLMTFIKQLEGINPNELSPDTRLSLEQLSQQSGVPFSLVTDSLKTQYLRQSYEDALDYEKTLRGEEAASRSERRLELAEEAAERAETKVSGRNLSDEEFRIAIRNMQSQGLSKQVILDAIETDTNIANKDRGRLIVSEIVQETTQETESFFSRLFGR